MPFTPGPWSVVEFDDCFPGIDADNHSVVLIGEQKLDSDGGIRGRTAEETHANAKLIASAPELVTALQQARALIDHALGKAGV